MIWGISIYSILFVVFAVGLILLVILYLSMVLENFAKRAQKAAKEKGTFPSSAIPATKIIIVAVVLAIAITAAWNLMQRLNAIFPPHLSWGP